MFETEDQLRAILMGKLEDMGFSVEKGIHIENIEVDLIALGNYKPYNRRFVQTSTQNIFAFEAKIATTPRRMRDVIEQAITRLLFADYVFVVLPYKADVWVSENKKEEKIIPKEIIKYMYGVYSRYIGIIAINNRKEIQIIRDAKRSGLTIRQLKDIIQKKLKRKHFKTIF